MEVRFYPAANEGYPVSVLCAVMRVSRSGFYDYLTRYASIDDDRSQTWKNEGYPVEKEIEKEKK